MSRACTFKLICALSLLIPGFSIPGSLAKDAKIKAEDVVARHLASIGTPEARAAIKDRIATGIVRVIFRLGSQGQLPGKCGLISEERKVRLSMNFSTLAYPGEQLAFDGERVTVGEVQPGQRSPFSDFVYTYNVILKEGLLGGTLSTAWPLLDLTGRQPELTYTGLKKVEGKQLHELSYKAKKGGGGLLVYLYFDPESFRHVRTQYRLVRPSSIVGRPEDSASQWDTIYTLVEQFEDFKEVGGLTLPHTYKLNYTVEAQRATFMADWNVTIARIEHDQQIDPKNFSVQPVRAAH
jgi:hypothetical protein